MIRPIQTLLVMLALIGVLVAPQTAVASSTDEDVIIFDQVQRASSGVISAQHSQADIDAIVQLDKQTAAIFGSHPTARATYRYRPSFHNWSVHIREVGSSRDLERIIVDDRSGVIVSRWFPPSNELAKRLTLADARRAASHDKECQRVRKETIGKRKDTTSTHYNGDDRSWEVDYNVANVTQVRCEVDDNSGNIIGAWTGPQIAWKMARGNRHAFGEDVNNWFIWWPMFFVFALLFLDPVRIKSWNTVDVFALLGFGISHEFFNYGNLDWSVPMAYPFLLYLFIRMSVLFVRGIDAAEQSRPVTRIAMWPPTRMVWVVALLFAGIRYGVNGWGSNVIDVGYAGVLGGDALVDGHLPYGHMPDDNPHGDTYGPLNYLLYVPAVLIFPNINPDVGQGLVSAHATTIASDVLCALALAFVGWRWISHRAAALLVCGWMVYPYTSFALNNNVNDLIVAALLLCAFAALPHAWLRGIVLGAAASVKFVPAIALTAMLHCGKSRRVRQVVWTLSGFIAMGVASFAFIVSYKHGWRDFHKATFGFQYDRESPFSIWGLYGWRTAQLIAQAALVLAVAAGAFWPRKRDFRQVAAGMGAAIIGSQLVLQHWFYLYIPWFFGFVLIVMVASREAYTQRL